MHLRGALLEACQQGCPEVTPEGASLSLGQATNADQGEPDVGPDITRTPLRLRTFLTKK